MKLNGMAMCGVFRLMCSRHVPTRVVARSRVTRLGRGGVLRSTFSSILYKYMMQSCIRAVCNIHDDPFIDPTGLES